ncbi:MAG TPA: RNA polymerase sigma factor [Gemmatimonadaceae bacterium]|nr:RNA polymerase sigma factor [Gemmatimonadaceae bacterium]
MATDPHPAAAAAADGTEPDAVALVTAAQRGEMDAFERLYRAHVGRVHAVCLRMCGDAGRARELTQDVFVRAWERLASFRGESAFGSWLHRLAVNVVLEAMRAERRRTARVDVAHDDPDDADGGGGGGGGGGVWAAAAAAADHPEERMDLERAIAKLPPGARTVFVLHDVEGYRHDEISKMTGSAPGTLRAQLHRARKLLMEALGR